MESMNENKVMKASMKARCITQKELAEKLGTTQNNLSGNMNRVRTSMDVFKGVLNALDYDVAVIDRRTGEIVWVVEP